jgi:hypothetical protein
MKLFRHLVALAITFSIAACAPSANDLALKLGAQPNDALELRGAEIKEITTSDDAAVLRSTTATLQDLGFTVTESAPQAGVLAGTKARNAATVGGVAGAIVLGVLFGASAMQYDKSQQINVTFVLSPGSAPDRRIARVSFDRYITNNKGVLWRTELVADPKIYQEFYSQLDKAMLLEKGAGS